MVGLREWQAPDETPAEVSSLGASSSSAVAVSAVLGAGIRNQRIAAAAMLMHSLTLSEAYQYDYQSEAVDLFVEGPSESYWSGVLFGAAGGIMAVLLLQFYRYLRGGVAANPPGDDPESSSAPEAPEVSDEPEETVPTPSAPPQTMLPEVQAFHQYHERVADRPRRRIRQDVPLTPTVMVDEYTQMYATTGGKVHLSSSCTGLNFARNTVVPKTMCTTCLRRQWIAAGGGNATSARWASFVSAGTEATTPE